MTKDPVCGIDLDTKSSHKSAHAGRIYVFCCRTCKTAFDKEPGQYLGISGAAFPGPRRPSAPLDARSFAHSSIGHLLQVVLRRSAPNEIQGGSIQLSSKGRSMDAR
jgi:YHS domain-containing protein